MFDLFQVPFSRLGSYMAFSYLKELPGRPAGVYFRSIHGQSNNTELFRLETTDGTPLTWDFQPAKLTLKYGSEAEIIFSEEHALRIRGKGTNLRMNKDNSPAVTLLDLSDRRLAVNIGLNNFQLGITKISGDILIENNWDGYQTAGLTFTFQPDETGIWEVELRDYPTSAYPAIPKHEGFDVLAERVRGEFERFYQNMPAVPAQYEELRRLAGYIGWSSIVSPADNMTRYGMLMSKNWMRNVWSWDHCFNAMALSGSMPDLAWDTYMLPFDHQDEYGALPDIVNDCWVNRMFVKPPVHGWTLMKLMERMQLSTAQLEEIYDKLGRLTNFWMVYRAGENGLPYYYHGNDSGWDNSTAFRSTMPISTPELPAYLVLQMRTLAKVAKLLGRELEREQWNIRADALKKRLVEEYWDGERLFGLDSRGNRIYSQSLLPLMTVALGEELPVEFKDYVISSILRPVEEGGWLTKWGVMTEQLDSGYYITDGYWRGPIWAPSTLLIADGLSRAGYQKEATMIAERFAATCEVGGFAENYDAMTGEGLRDRAYTWTSSSFLVLMRDFL